MASHTEMNKNVEQSLSQKQGEGKRGNSFKYAYIQSLHWKKESLEDDFCFTSHVTTIIQTRSAGTSQNRDFKSH